MALGWIDAGDTGSNRREGAWFNPSDSCSEPPAGLPSQRAGLVLAARRPAPAACRPAPRSGGPLHGPADLIHASVLSEEQAQTRRRKWLGLGRDLAIGATLIVCIQWWRALGVAAEGLPDTTLTLLDGASVALAGPRERPMLVQLEASWCGVCRLEDASLRAIAEDHDVLVIASRSGDEAAVRRFAEEHELARLRIAVDRDGRLAAQLGVSAFPTTLFVGRDGRVSDAEVGYTSELGMRARLAWADL